MKKNAKTTILALAFAGASLALPLRSDASLDALRGGGCLSAAQRSALLRSPWRDSAAPDSTALSSCTEPHDLCRRGDFVFTPASSMREESDGKK